MKTAILLCALLGTAAFAANVAAQNAAPAAAPAASGNKPNTEQPIHVNSDNLFADMKANIGIYTGHVVVTQDTIKLRANEVKVYATNGKPTKLDATGNIVFDSPSGSATGDASTYDVDAHLITLTGRDVVLVKGQNVMHGTKLVVHTDTSQAQLYSQANNGRVQGLLIPPPKQNAAGGAKSKKTQPQNGTKGGPKP